MYVVLSGYGVYISSTLAVAVFSDSIHDRHFRDDIFGYLFKIKIIVFSKLSWLGCELQGAVDDQPLVDRVGAWRWSCNYLNQRWNVLSLPMCNQTIVTFSVVTAGLSINNTTMWVCIPWMEHNGKFVALLETFLILLPLHRWLACQGTVGSLIEFDVWGNTLYQGFNLENPDYKRFAAEMKFSVVTNANAWKWSGWMLCMQICYNGQLAVYIRPV